ncbi:MAG: hypothetical protein HZA20_13720 [Nitrospirae bacterium]|nr:hypothetical protein [Nitrospirota bacterium]
MKVAAIAAALMFGLLFYSEPAAAKPQPPKELLEIFRSIQQIETGYESGAWEKALSLTNRIESQISAASARIGKDVNASVINDFKVVLVNLRGAIIQKNLNRSTNGLIMLQRLLFDIMMAYDYKKPPIFTVIEKYIDEAAESAEKSDFTNVVNEMKEIDALFRQAGQLLQERNIKPAELDGISSLVQEIIEAGSAGNREGTESLLKKLKARHKAVTAR